MSAHLAKHELESWAENRISHVSSDMKSHENRKCPSPPLIPSKNLFIYAYSLSVPLRKQRDTNNCKGHVTTCPIDPSISGHFYRYIRHKWNSFLIKGPSVQEIKHLIFVQIPVKKAKTNRRDIFFI